MDFADKNLTCADCGESFVFTAKDQEFYAGRGFTEPKRCPECRRMRKEKRGMGGEGGDRGGAGSVQYEVVCAECGKKTTVPFEPRGTRPVYCRDCFEQKRRPGGGGGWQS
jgi:CxxC-x17-CxxC domain-containing protein